MNCRIPSMPILGQRHQRQQRRPDSASSGLAVLPPPFNDWLKWKSLPTRAILQGLSLRYRDGVVAAGAAGLRSAWMGFGSSSPRKYSPLAALISGIATNGLL